MTNPLTPTWEPRIVLQMLVASDDEAQPRGIMDCVDNDGKPYQSAHMAKLVEHARALVSAPTTIGERQAIAEGVGECTHEWTNEGPRIPLRYGSAATEICSGCGVWRQVRFADAWRDPAELAKCFMDIEEAQKAGTYDAVATPATNAPVSDREAEPRKLTMPNGRVLEVEYPNDVEWAKAWSVRYPDTGQIGTTGEQDWELVETYGLTALFAAYRAALRQTLPIHGEMREALERIDQFVTKFRQPWGSWKTVWWEGEVSDEAAFSADNALMHVANIARNALQGDGL